MRRLIAAVAVLAACSSSDIKGDEVVEAFRPLDVGAVMPPYVALTLAGDTVHVGRAGAPQIVNVWATWCASCREEMAALDSLESEYAARGVRVLAVSVDQGSVAKVQHYAETNQLRFAISHDPAGDIQRLYRVVGVPTTFLIGKDGKLLWKHTGNVADVISEVRQRVNEAAPP